MNLYDTPMRGEYTYRTRNCDGSFNLFDISVEIIGETAKSYLVCLLSPIVGHPVKSTMTVRKHNVRVQKCAEKPRPDCSGAWWNN